MRAFLAYMRWLSTGIPDGAKLRGGGTLKIKEPERAANLRRGSEIFSEMCATCHGANGLGQRAQSGSGYQFPPLWGSDSYNDGAGMGRLLTVAAYALHNMPIGTRFDAPCSQTNKPMMSPPSSSARNGQRRQTSTKTFLSASKSRSILHTARTRWLQSRTTQIWSIWTDPRKSTGIGSHVAHRKRTRAERWCK